MASDFPALDEVDRVVLCCAASAPALAARRCSSVPRLRTRSFSDQTADDRVFWQRWKSTHEESLRAIQAISFRLASEWFDCRVPVEVVEEFDRRCGADPAVVPTLRASAGGGQSPSE